MSTPARRRLMRDFKRIQQDSASASGGISASPLADNVMIWNAIIIGPEDTPFEDGTFRLCLTFDEQYPNKPPTVKFTSEIFHPNVYATGDLCLDILQNRWSPTYDVASILTSIQSLLNDPNINSPANAEAASLYKDHRSQYIKRVRQTVEKSWTEDLNDIDGDEDDDEDDEDEDEHGEGDEEDEWGWESEKQSFFSVQYFKLRFLSFKLTFLVVDSGMAGQLASQ